MRLYTVALNNLTPNTANDLLTIIAPAGKTVRLKRVRASGEASSSTVMRTLIGRSSGQAGTNPGTTPTPTKQNSSDSAAGSTVYSGAFGTTQPTVTQSYNESWNAFGGGFDLVLDGREIYIRDTEQISIRNTVGTGLMSLEVEFEEL